MKKRFLLPILIIVLMASALAVVGCNRERPAPTPAGPTAVLKVGTASPAPPGIAVTKVVLSGQTPQGPVAATPAPLTPGTPVPLATSAPSSGETSSGPASAASGGETLYTVQRGDTLGKIAAKYGVTTKQITDLNGITNPNMIVPGQKLRIPGTAATAAPSGSQKTYTIQAGDTLAGIATRFGVTVQALQQANNISNPNQVYSGQVLKIP